MPSNRNTYDRLLLSAIILVSVLGIAYFGIRAVLDNMQKNPENPFEYNLDSYTQDDSSLFRYTQIQSISVDMDTLCGIAIDGDDCIYVSGDHSLVKLSPGGIVQSTLSTQGTARCIAVDENDELYLGMDDHVEVYNKKGNRKAHWDSPGEEAIITSIAVSETHVFTADAGNRIVWKFDRSGNRLGRIGDKDESRDIPGFVIPSPYFDVAIDPDGFLWAANTGRHSLENYTDEGNLRSSWGVFSMEIEGFCGCCNPSHFIILEDGSFVTSEKGIPRVKVYNRLGQLSAVIAGPDNFIPGTTGLDLAVDSAGRIYILDPKQKTIRVYTKTASKEG
jgi:hypothetical protein